jgi:hypothetical protein
MLDELTSAEKMLQAAAYQLILDHTVGNHKLHPSCYKMAAGNLESDNAVVTEMSTALASRMGHIFLHSHLPSWLDWAYDNHIDQRITSFLNFQPKLLNHFSPDSAEITFPCERTWEMLSKYIKTLPIINLDHVADISGIIGMAGASQFITFNAHFNSLVDYKEIVRDPKGVDISQEPSAIYAMSGMIASKVTKADMDKVIHYIDRLPMEFQVITLRAIVAINKDSDVRFWPAVDTWLSNNFAQLNAE